MAGNTSEEGPPTERELASVEADFQDKIDDVRERVIQIKREVDGKAPADHDHEELEAALSELEGELSELDADVADMREDIDTGFENFEEILESLTDRADRLADRTDRLAGAILDLRRVVEALGAEGDDPVDPIARTANRHGIRTADCEDCDGEVDIALLRRPECPHCGATFNDVRPSSGWFDSATLAVGAPPALTPAPDEELEDHGIEDMRNE